MKLAKNLFDAPSVVGLMLQCLIQVSWVQADPLAFSSALLLVQLVGVLLYQIY